MILIIDDDKVSRRVIAACLDRLSLKSLQCENGREGWEMLWENSDVNLVITDMVMPDMDGRELMHLIRGQDELKSLPVIMISGILCADEIAPIMKISPTNTFFLAKPLDINLLEKHIQAIGVREGSISFSSTSAH
jgi:CheY-like chemotaxis protein